MTRVAVDCSSTAKWTLTSLKTSLFLTFLSCLLRLLLSGNCMFFKHCEILRTDWRYEFGWMSHRNSFSIMLRVSTGLKEQLGSVERSSISKMRNILLPASQMWVFLCLIIVNWVCFYISDWHVSNVGHFSLFSWLLFFDQSSVAAPPLTLLQMWCVLQGQHVSFQPERAVKPGFKLHY